MLQTLKKSNMNLKMISCSSCNEPMPELRFTKYGYSYCVKCSEAGLGVGRKQGIPVLMGEGDHTWVETVIMDADQYEQYIAQEKAERLDFDKEDKRNLHGPVTIINTEEDA